jgi:hypothetical protein
VSHGWGIGGFPLFCYSPATSLVYVDQFKVLVPTESDHSVDRIARRLEGNIRKYAGGKRSSSREMRRGSIHVIPFRRLSIAGSAEQTARFMPLSTKGSFSLYPKFYHTFNTMFLKTFKHLFWKTCLYGLSFTS